MEHNGSHKLNPKYHNVTTSHKREREAQGANSEHKKRQRECNKGNSEARSSVAHVLRMYSRECECGECHHPSHENRK